MGKSKDMSIGDPYTITVTRQEISTFVVFADNEREAVKFAKEIIGKRNKTSLYEVCPDIDKAAYSEEHWKYTAVAKGDVGRR